MTKFDKVASTYSTVEKYHLTEIALSFFIEVVGDNFADPS